MKKQTKLIIICGGDRLGKGSLIKGLCEYYDYKNIMIRHCDKPPKEIESKYVLDYQFECFNKESRLIHRFIQTFGNSEYCYHNNIIIYDRFYLGEYVYSQMFRGGNAKELKQLLIEWEKFNLMRMYEEDCKVYLITLTADPEFFLIKEDGQSFSKNLEDKTRELELFKEAHNFSLIKNKLLVKVDINGEFRGKEEILTEVINFIK
jgi:thymidylate kinase